MQTTEERRAAKTAAQWRRRAAKWGKWQRFDVALVAQGAQVKRRGKGMPRFRVVCKRRKKVDGVWEVVGVKLFGPLGKEPMMSGMRMVATFFETTIEALRRGEYRIRVRQTAATEEGNG